MQRPEGPGKRVRRRSGAGWALLPPAALRCAGLAGVAGTVAALLPLWLAVGSGALAAQDGGSEDGGGSEEALFLLLPIGAQGIGLGRAMTALATEEGAFWNPAGLARETSRRAFVYRGDQLAGAATALSLLFPSRRVGTFGLSYLLLDIGDQELRDEFGSVLGSISIRNHLAVASYAASLPWGIDAGINMKLVQFRVACRGQCNDLDTRSTAYALDAGIQAQPFPDIPVRFGWMLAHAGTEFQVVNQAQSDPLPTRVRLAVAYQALDRTVDDVPMSLWVTVEGEERARNPGSPSLYAGLDFSAADLFHLRAGYVAGKYDQTNGASVGVGFSVDRFDLNFAKSLTRSMVTGESQPIHVTLAATY